MTWKVSLRPAADKDLAEARDWYEQQRAGLAEEFLASIADALVRLEVKPELFPIFYRGFRKILTVRFPDKVFFKIEGMP